MKIIWTSSDIFRRAEYKNEADLEDAILIVQRELFGVNRIYLDVKKKIGTKGRKRNIPDGYLIDISGNTPRLFVVENELASHDPIRHVAIQLLEFSLSFESEPRLVSQILFDALKERQDALDKCEQYVRSHKGFRNLDHFFDFLVHDSPFSALVIIDDTPEELETVLAERFRFGVEILELVRFENRLGDCIYHFKPFLADVDEDIDASQEDTRPQLDIEEIDTIVVPAHDDGFAETFMREARWYAIRIHGTMRPQIKYIAVYRTAPISAITHWAPVSSIETWKDSGKYVVNFAESASEIEPIRLVKRGKVKALQNIRYTSIQRLFDAKTMDDIW